MKKVLILITITIINLSTAQTNQVQDNYTKKEVYIPMRDGTKLFTII